MQTEQTVQKEQRVNDDTMIRIPSPKIKILADGKKVYEMKPIMSYVVSLKAKLEKSKQVKITALGKAISYAADVAICSERFGAKILKIELKSKELQSKTGAYKLSLIEITMEST